MERIAPMPKARVATVCGRYYGMDRSKNWDKIRIAYRAMAFGEGQKSGSILETIEMSYQSDLTPDNAIMFDEYLKPIISEGYEGMKAGDAVFNFNYRQDRAIQISKAFVDPSCPAYDGFSRSVHYFGLTRYYDEFVNYLMPPIDDSGSMTHLLGEVLSQAGLKQLRIAETQKFRHVTSFFNGKRTKPFPGEDQLEIPGVYDPASFASHPEMNASDVTSALMDRLDEDYQFVAVDYPSPDMVGHTGDYEAARESARIVDENVKQVSEKGLSCGYTVLITADHGNSEEMLDKAGEPKTSHTINPVKLHILTRRKSVGLLTGGGILSDIAPLILKIMGMPIPAEMTSEHLSDQWS